MNLNNIYSQGIQLNVQDTAILAYDALRDKSATPISPHSSLPFHKPSQKILTAK